MTSGISKKVALFVCHDLVGLLMLNKIVPEMKKAGVEPVIFNTETRMNRKFRRPSPSIVSAFNVLVLEETIIPFLEKNEFGSTGPNLTYRQLAQKHAIEYREIQDVNNASFTKGITTDRAFIGAVSMRFLQVFEKPVIEAFREKGFMWNIHSGFLPGYKGLLTPYRAIDNGDKEYGLTLHEIAAGIDEGNILAKAGLPLDAQRPILDLYLDTVDLADEMLAAAFSKVADGHVPIGVPQSGAAKYYSNPTDEEFMRYMERGIFYVDPDRTLRRIVDAFAWEGTQQNIALNERIRTFLDRKEARDDDKKKTRRIRP
jgi:folate-dependent phosphoribosylglycinamide formyltransferase PurN